MTTEKKEVKEVTETVKDNKEIAKETETKEVKPKETNKEVKETKEDNKEDKATTTTRKRRTTTKTVKSAETDTTNTTNKEGYQNYTNNKEIFQAYITKEEFELIQKIQKEKTLDNPYKVLMYLVNNYFDNKDLIDFLLNKATETEKEVKTSKGIVLDYFAEYDNNDKGQLNNRINKDLLKSWNEFINSNSQVRGNDLLSQAMYEFMKNHSK